MIDVRAHERTNHEQTPIEELSNPLWVCILCIANLRAKWSESSIGSKVPRRKYAPNTSPLGNRDDGPETLWSFSSRRHSATLAPSPFTVLARRMARLTLEHLRHIRDRPVNRGNEQ